LSLTNPWKNVGRSLSGRRRRGREALGAAVVAVAAVRGRHHMGLRILSPYGHRIRAARRVRRSIVVRGGKRAQTARKRRNDDGIGGGMVILGVLLLVARMLTWIRIAVAVQLVLVLVVTSLVVFVAGRLLGAPPQQHPEQQQQQQQEQQPEQKQPVRVGVSRLALQCGTMIARRVLALQGSDQHPPHLTRGHMIALSMWVASQVQARSCKQGAMKVEQLGRQQLASSRGAVQLVVVVVVAVAAA
jgi:hypothetical protein